MYLHHADCPVHSSKLHKSYAPWPPCVPIHDDTNGFGPKRSEGRLNHVLRGLVSEASDQNRRGCHVVEALAMMGTAARPPAPTSVVMSVTATSSIVSPVFAPVVMVVSIVIISTVSITTITPFVVAAITIVI